MDKNKELVYQITIDPTIQIRKPSVHQIGTITNNLKLQTGLTINEFATYSIIPYGYTWVGSMFNGSICNTNWKEQSVFALDFDKGLLNVDEALKRLNQIEIYPQLWYSTFSDSPSLRKYRIMLFLDNPIKDENIRKIIADALLVLFPEADHKCKNASRLFFGGKESTILNQAPISSSKLIDLMCIQLITNDGGRTRKIPSDIHKITCMKNGIKRMSLYNMYRNTHFSPEYRKINTSEKGGDVIDINIARRRIKILDEFLNGEWLYHDQLFGLATNLVYIKGGRKLMNETMEHYNTIGKTAYTNNNFNILTYISKVSYPPMPIYSFSNYSEDKDLYDIISTSKDIRGLIEPIDTINKIPIEEAEEMFKSKYYDVIANGIKGKIYLFKLPTAIGKTEMITSTISTIALPTNRLKDEVFSRMKIPCVSTPDAVVFENDSLNRKLNYYYSIGLPKKAISVLYDVINEKNNDKYLEMDIKKAKIFLSELNSCYYSNDTILTTHNRALHSEYLHDTLIFDEDPINSLLSVKQVRISDLQKLDNQLRLLNNDLSNIIDYLKNTNAGEVLNTPVFAIDIDQMIEKISISTIETNVFELFNSSNLIKDTYDHDLIHYVVKRKLPEKKIIILSASLSVYIYQKLFGDRIEVIDIQDVVQKGEIIQYTNRSCSRNSLSRYVNDISKEVKDRPVITFKSFQNQFLNPVKEMYFGNCSGYDRLKGNDIVVVGTPHRDNIQYLLMAKILGIDFKTTNTTMSYQKIVYNGFRFKFNCYDHEELRNIQLSLIESDLIQAVGRARTLRTNSKVELYSNFPLRITTDFFVVRK